MKAIQTADHSINVISVVTNVEVSLNPITFSVSWFIKIDVSSIIIPFPRLKVWPDTGSLTWQSPLDNSSKEHFSCPGQKQLNCLGINFLYYGSIWDWGRVKVSENRSFHSFPPNPSILILTFIQPDLFSSHFQKLW